MNATPTNHKDQQHAERTVQIESFCQLYRLLYDLRFLLLLAYEVDQFINIVASHGSSAHSCNTRLLNFMLNSLGEPGDALVRELRDGLQRLKIWHNGVTNTLDSWENILTQSIRHHLRWAIYETMGDIKSKLLTSALAEPKDFETWSKVTSLQHSLIKSQVTLHKKKGFTYFYRVLKHHVVFFLWKSDIVRARSRFRSSHLGIGDFIDQAPVWISAPIYLWPFH